MATDADRWIATSREPWLAIEGVEAGALAGRLVRIAYRACYWDPPTRPVFRFLDTAGAMLGEAIGPAPLEAAALWTGRVPRETRTIHVSPSDRPGPFGFAIERIVACSFPRLLVEGWERARGPARSAVLTALIGWRPEADNNLAWAIGAHPLDCWPAYAATRRRPLDLEGVDRRRVGASETPPFHIVVRAAADDGATKTTLNSLAAQSVAEWRAIVVGDSPPPSADPKVRIVATAGEAAAALAGRDGWAMVVDAGTSLRPEALALVSERAARDPDAAMFYGDALAGGRPVLSPGWAPRLCAALPFLHDTAFARPRDHDVETLAAVVAGAPWPAPARGDPRPLHRIVLSRPARPEPVASPPRGPTPVAAARAAIIVPTKDQPALVERLVASLRARSRLGSFTLVVVDNGAADGPAAALLARLAREEDVVVIPRPGPFAFSAACNAAAATRDESVLVFLNDDMEVLSDGWLDRLVDLALRPDVGAVGARLTYPDGRLQHVGVLVGMGGSAGHFGAPAPGDDPGWAGRNRVVHEVSAVTGACLAVARDKFEAVGGFDADALPIELSDIDLCLKLGARGWRCLVDPAVHLMHEESFSRGGATFRRLAKYGDQRRVFVERWRAVLRDDPVFHPALSLYSWRAALG